MRPIPQYPNGHFVSTYPWFRRIQIKNSAYELLSNIKCRVDPQRGQTPQPDLQLRNQTSYVNVGLKTASFTMQFSISTYQ